MSKSHRLRCTQCKKLITNPLLLVDHPKMKMLRRHHALGLSSDHHKKLMKQRFHMAMRNQSAGGGRYSMRTYLAHCGPVEVEEVEEYVEQFEYFIGEDLS